MADPAWPEETVPIVFEARSYSASANPHVISSPVDRGPPKTRRRFPGTTVTRRLTLRIEAAHRAAWDAWLETIGGGSLPFTWPNPEGGGTERAQLVVPEDGFQLRQAHGRPGSGLAFDVPIEVVVLPAAAP